MTQNDIPVDNQCPRFASNSAYVVELKLRPVLSPYQRFPGYTTQKQGHACDTKHPLC